ncbi:hypothetical protein HNR61_003419 [Actinomadura namibiensis]|uniref:Uncharacterized protein n=1 Tax=Actinomadura namibiensis TaxID=182080 RepID=A0A7W3QLQ9_ACTNM|nr:hypothetical protein [Actinomadura namibiensis]
MDVLRLLRCLGHRLDHRTPPTMEFQRDRLLRVIAGER